MLDNINDQAQWLSKIKINELSNKALVIASKLSRNIRKQNGCIVRLQDPSMPMLLAEQVVEIDDIELNQLYRSFLEEAMRINDSGFPTPSKSKGKNQDAGTNPSVKNQADRN